MTAESPPGGGATDSLGYQILLSWVEQANRTVRKPPIPKISKTEILLLFINA